MIEKLDEAIEDTEQKFDSDGVSGYRGEFSSLRRQAARIRRHLAPQREGLEKLTKEPSAILSDDDRFILREEADRITRYLETLDLVRERAMVAQEEIIAKLALEQNNRMYILAIVAAIFLPLSFVTGMMGMNVAGLPGLQNENAFAITVGLMLLAGAAIIAIFKLKKWL
jgi:zinc transporter